MLAPPRSRLSDRQPLNQRFRPAPRGTHYRLAFAGAQGHRAGMADDRIRLASSLDIERLSDLKRATFRETFIDGFHIPYPPDDIATFESEHYGTRRIAADIADPAHRTWVVERGDALIAYAHVGPCKLPHPEAQAEDGEIYQLYLRGEAQGAGLGKKLLTITTDYLMSARPGPIWLGVWSGNARAQNLYRAQGFTHVGEYHFAVGSWRDEEYIFRRD
jgi:diamine N-acetyltransferase